MSELLTQVT